MHGKILFSFFVVLSIIELCFVLKEVSKIKKNYGLYLCRTIYMAIVAMISNIVIAFSMSDVVSEIAYCFYFASLDWMLLALSAFCAYYTEHYKLIKYLTVPSLVVVILDSASVFANLFLHHQFTVYEFVNNNGFVFLLTEPKPFYNVHLTLDYIGVASCMIYLIVRTCKSHGFYKYKYFSIVLVLSLVIVLNVIYMMFKLPLDLSVVFYALAASLIYFFIERYVPRILTNQAMKRAVNEMGEGLILFDIDSRCIYVNDFIKKYFKIDETSCTLDAEPVATAVCGKPVSEVIPGVSTYVKPSGNSNIRDRHYRVAFNNLSDSKANFLGSYILVDDVTEEYYVMQELASAKEEADGASAAKSNFLANMSHEIRTPLNSLLGMNEMIIREANDKKLIEYAENIKIAGNSLLSLLNDILDFSKIEAGRMSIVESDYSIHKVLRDCHNILGPAARDKGLEYIIECDETLPSVLFGDEMRVRQILSNLLSNAIKYTSEGFVKVKITAVKKESELTHLKIDVIDSGIGISEEDQKILFEAFQRVDESKNRNIEGTGLGLTITKELTTMMHGEISVESEPGKGSCFTVIVPQAIADPKPIGKFTADIIPERTEYKESFIAPDARILVVDDVPMNIKVVKALLGKTKVDVQTAGGGEEAIERCKTEKFDLIFMDHMMPSPDGVEAFKQIRTRGANVNTPVVVLTANALNGVEAEYRKIGFIDYLSKPVKGGDLEKALVKYLPAEKVTVNE